MASSSGPADSPRERAIFSRTSRSLGGLRIHGPSLVVFLACAGVAAGLSVLLQGRGRARERAAFDAEATSIVANLRSAFELPLEVLGSTAALFEASHEVSRAEFARFVKPALERHPGIRALEWIPVVAADDRPGYETAARADGIVGFEFRERAPGGAMVRAGERGSYLPIYYMEPGHPLVLGFDCASERERRASAERARARGAAVASERITLLDDPPSVYSIAVFHPVFDPARPRAPENVRGFTCEVFRVRAVAEQAIEASVRRGIQVLLVDADSTGDRRVLFESSPALASAAPAGLSLETILQFADRRWRIVLSTTPGYRGGFQGLAWFSLLAGIASGALLAGAMSATRVIRRLRRQVRAAQQLGQYTLLEKLGEGAVGVVYKARHALMRRPTAIKLLAGESGNPQRLARFEREVQLTSELTHPNTIAIYDYGRTPEGVFYYAMEYVDGLTLEQLVELSGPVSAARVAHFLRQACGALAEAHAVGLIHRDIKPANVMVCKRGGIADFLKVMDFGLVKDIGVGPDGKRAVAITESAGMAVVGTPLYLAPEAIARPSEVDGRADLYALGAVAYYLLVGAPVFGGQTVVEVCSQHLHATPVPPSERAPQTVPAALEAVILRCLQKRPADRYPSAEDLAAALAGATAPWTDADARAWWQARGDALVQQVRAAPVT